MIVSLTFNRFVVAGPTSSPGKRGRQVCQERESERETESASAKERERQREREREESRETKMGYRCT